MGAESADGVDEPMRLTVRQLRAWRAGDGEALSFLFERYRPVVLRIVRMRRPSDLARVMEPEDLVQEALTKAFEKLDKYDEHSEGTFRNWLARVAENHVIDALRSAGSLKRDVRRVQGFAPTREEGRTVSSVTGREGTPSEALGIRELEERREQAITRLPQAHRELIAFREGCGMTFPEIGRELGKHEATVRMMYTRAVQRLGEMLTH